MRFHTICEFQHMLCYFKKTSLPPKSQMVWLDELNLMKTKCRIFLLGNVVTCGLARTFVNSSLVPELGAGDNKFSARTETDELAQNGTWSSWAIDQLPNCDSESLIVTSGRSIMTTMTMIWMRGDVYKKESNEYSLIPLVPWCMQCGVTRGLRQGIATCEDVCAALHDLIGELHLETCSKLMPNHFLCIIYKHLLLASH